MMDQTKLMIVRILAAGLLTGNISPAQNNETSANTEVLKTILKNHPTSDLNEDGILTREEAKKYNLERKKARAEEPVPGKRAKYVEPTHANVAYGDHALQVFDIWLAKSKEGNPTPLAIYIHGGGFRGGDKGRPPGQLLQQYLDAGVSYASINYRLTDVGPYPMQHHDCARGLQYIRHNAEKWNLDPNRIACHGGSAGAGISLWLAFHDDLAEPESKDPISRQSTRIIAAATRNGQSTYDLHEFRKIFDFPELKMHEALYPFYRVSEEGDWDSERVKKAMFDASAINHVDKSDKVPVFATYGGRGPGRINAETNPSAWVHHMKLGLHLKEKMVGLGLECHVTYKTNPAGGYKDVNDFLIRKLSQ